MHSETFKLITCIFLCTGQTLIGHFYHVLGLKKDPQLKMVHCQNKVDLKETTYFSSHYKKGLLKIDMMPLTGLQSIAKWDWKELLNH